MKNSPRLFSRGVQGAVVVFLSWFGPFLNAATPEGKEPGEEPDAEPGAATDGGA